MSYDYMLGYMQGRRRQPMRIFNEEHADDHRAGYVKGNAIYGGEVLLHRQTVNRYNK